MRCTLKAVTGLWALLLMPALVWGDDKAVTTKPAKAGDLEIAVPEGWKKKQPKSQMRLV